MKMATTALAAAALALALATATAAATAAAPYTNRVLKEQADESAADGWLIGPRAERDHPVVAHVFVRQTNLDVLESELWAVSDPDSPRYGKHYTMDEVNRLVAPRPESVVAVLAWLQHHGVDTRRDVEATGNSDILQVRTTAGVLEQLVGTAMHLWKHPQRGHVAMRAASGAYSLPEEVHEHIDFVGPTTRFPNPLRASTVANFRPESGVTPAFLRQVYNVGTYSAQSDKSNVAIASFLGQYFSPSDLQTFFQQYDAGSVGRTYTINGENDASNPGVEAELDSQYAAAMGANVSLFAWSTPGQQPHNPGSEPFLTWLYSLGNDTSGVTVSSQSYGDNEPGVWLAYGKRVNVEFQKAGARGVSLLFSSGDGGVGGGQPSFCTKFIPTFPAASPYVTAVGGTTSSDPEVAASLSSGGFSNYWPQPSYQTSAVNSYLSGSASLPPSSDYNATGAGFPDVSAQAENFAVVVDGFTQGVAGTSCSSPTFAGILSLVNDARLAAGKSTLGWLNPLFYKNPTVFNDVTSGNNPGCSTNGFEASAGWDPVTGLGTANFGKLKALALSLQ